MTAGLSRAHPQRAGMALLIVDVQNGLLQDHPFREREFLQNLQRLVAAARENGVEVIYVQHDGGKDDELEAGTDGFAIVAEVAPLNNEHVFVKTRNSAFLGTDLHTYLTEKQIGAFVLCGMQTEYCIDATCKSALERGYKAIIPKGCTTSFDNPLFSAETLCRFFEEGIWDGRFASVPPLEQVLDMFAAPTETVYP